MSVGVIFAAVVPVLAVGFFRREFTDAVARIFTLHEITVMTTAVAEEVDDCAA